MKNFIKKNIIMIVIVLVGISATGTALYFQQPGFIFDLFSQTKSTNNGKTITYSGENGKTALELLQKKTKVTTSGTGKNAFVTSINDVKSNPSNQYWQVMINGKPAEVGAGSLVTNNDDTITWELTSF